MLSNKILITSLWAYSQSQGQQAHLTLQEPNVRRLPNYNSNSYVSSAEQSNSSTLNIFGVTRTRIQPTPF
jgi:hypothetical protein